MEQAIHGALGYYRTMCSNMKMVAALSLDIRGAVDHADWNVNLSSLVKAAVPQYLYQNIKSYLEDRWVVNRGEKCKLERGCPQGSVPALWNIQYDIIITSLAQKYPNLCIYADDTLLIIIAPSITELERESSNIIIAPP